MEPDHTMPRFRLRSRWLLLFAGAIILAVCGFWLGKSLLPADPVKQGWAAYARGDWEVAVERARERLKTAGDDTDALRLLARASVRLGRDSSALAVFGRLGADAMTPDDLCLLGIALIRSGNSRGLEVWEQALAMRAGPRGDALRADAGLLQSRPACRRRHDGPPPCRLPRLGRPGRGTDRSHRTGSQ